MLLQRVRHARLVALLSGVYHLALAFPTQTPSAYDDIPSLQVDVPHSGVLFGRLGRSIVIPCLASSTPRMLPRVKWTLLSEGQETQILVARGDRVKVNEAYRGRVDLLNNSSSPGDMSLWILDLRSSDSGHYRCEVQQGLEDASDLVQLKVKGVVFHYRNAMGRYSLSFHQAQAACQAIGAQIATGSQLQAAYFDGYEQCDAGWIEDQTVRYPIQNPREACYGDMDGQPGVRNYGLMNAEDHYDVYCYVEQMDGEVFHDPVPQQLSFEGARSYCRAAGAQLASTAQLYMAWSEGLDHCSPGWLSDGSVRYPIRTPRERCGGSRAGVKTLYRFSNQTVFPEPSSLFDVYCFKATDDTTDSTVDSTTPKPGSLEQDVVILRVEDEELQLSQNSEQIEREVQSVLETIPLFPPAKENDLDEHPTLLSDTSENPLSTTATLDLIRPFDRTSSSTETNYDSQHTTRLTNSTTQSTDSYQNFTGGESTRKFPKSNDTHPQNLTETDTITKESTEPLDRAKLLLETNLYFNGTEMYETQEEILEAPPVTLDPTQTVKQVEKGEPATQTTEQPADLTSLWSPMSGSGDASQESHQEGTVFKFIPTSTTHRTPPVSTGSSPPESFTSVTGPTTTSRSKHSHSLASDNLLEFLSTVVEGSTSLEFEDTIDSVERQLLPTRVIHFRASSPTTEALERPTDLITAIYQPSGHGAFFDMSTTSYEEASGLEPDVASALTKEHIASTVKDNVVEDATEAPAIEDVKVVRMFAQNFRPNKAFGKEEEQEDNVTVYPKEVTPMFEESNATRNPNGSTATFIFEDGDVPANPKEEAATTTPIFDVETKDMLTPKEGTEMNPIFQELAKANVTLSFTEATATLRPKEEATVTPVFDEEAKTTLTPEKRSDIMPIFEEETKAILNFEKASKVTQRYEEAINISAKIEEVGTITPAYEEENKAMLNLVKVTQTFEEEEANVTANSKEVATITPAYEEEVKAMLNLERATKVMQRYEEEANFTANSEAAGTTISSYEEEATVVSEKEAKIIPVFRHFVTPTFQDKETTSSEVEVSITPIFSEDTTEVTTPDDETSTGPGFDEKITVFPLNSKSSNWALLTTTTRPQESLKDLEISTKSTAISSTAVPQSSSATEATKMAATRTTTWWSKRTWSPTTSAPKVLHWTSEPLKVTRMDVDFSPTQAPTHHVLHNERAAVGGKVRIAVPPCDPNKDSTI
ncbi:versican core protein-like isoform X2 [Dunckerocampus dactyliophorus]|uniref:versican core protein-like isoform X2 n=1 Tax=Dunckerocampus dactyliophorus TaxID=161453 RepID=UPI0024063082|nr:versican core protein-like isoform X2 [Dunckerocampus dactyliophorus]